MFVIVVNLDPSLIFVGKVMSLPLALLSPDRLRPFSQKLEEAETSKKVIIDKHTSLSL